MRTQNDSFSEKNEKKKVKYTIKKSILHNLPPELHFSVYSHFDFIKLMKIAKKDKTTRNEISNNLLLWRDLYKKVTWKYPRDKKLEEITEEIIFYYKIRNNIINSKEETKYELDTDQLDITSLIYSNNKIFVASDDTTVKIFSNEKLKYVASGHKGGVWAMDVFNDYLLTGSTDKKAILWDIKNFIQLCTLNGHRCTIRCCKLTKTHIITGSRDGDIRIWSLNGTCLFVLKGHTESVRCISVSQTHLVSGSYDGTVFLWDYTKGKLIKKLTQHTQRVYSVLIKDKIIVSGSQDGFVHVHNTDKGELLYKFKAHRNIVAWLNLEKHNHINYLYTSGADGKTLKIDLQTGKLIYSINLPRPICATKVDYFLLVIAYATKVELYNSITGKFIRILFEDPQLKSITDVHFNKGKMVIAYINRTGKTKITSLNYNSKE